MKCIFAHYVNALLVLGSPKFNTMLQIQSQVSDKWELKLLSTYTAVSQWEVPWLVSQEINSTLLVYTDVIGYLQRSWHVFGQGTKLRKVPALKSRRWTLVLPVCTTLGHLCVLLKWGPISITWSK